MVDQPTPASTPQTAIPGADLGTLAGLGIIEPLLPPAPQSPEPEQPPDPPRDTPPPDPAHVETLTVALADVRYATTPDDDAAIQAVAALDAVTVNRVAAWIHHDPSLLPVL